MDNKNTGKWVMMFILFMAFFSVNYSQFLLSAFSKEFAVDFCITQVQLSALTFSYTIVAGVVGMFGGMLADKFGLCRIMTVLSLLSLSGAIIRLFTTNYQVYFCCSLLIGTLYGGSFSVNGKIIRAWFDEREQGLAFSVITTGSALSVIFAMFAYQLYETYHQALTHATVIIAISSFLWVAVGRDAPKGVVLTKSPDMFRNIPKIVKVKGFWLVIIASLFYSSSVNSLAGRLSGVLSFQYGIPMSQANLLTAALSTFTLLGGIFLPLLQRRLGKFRPMLIVLFVIAILCLMLMIIIPVRTVLPILIVLGASVGVQSGLYSAVMSRLPGMKDDLLGSAMGLQVLLRFIVGVFVLVPYLVTPLIEKGYQYYYLIIIVFCLIQTTATWLMPEVGKKPKKQ